MAVVGNPGGAPPAKKADAGRSATLRTTALLIVSISLVHSDQNLLAPNLTAAASDLGLTDPAERDAKMGGGLAFGLFMVGAPAALLIGAGSDGLLGVGGGARLRRVDLLALVLAVGAAGCAGSAMATSYPHLFVARAVTGVSLAGAFPLAMSLISDLYGPERRTQLSGRLGVAMNLGVLAGQTLAGWIGPDWGWRAPFQIVSFMLVSVACAVWRFLPEPARLNAGYGLEDDDDEEITRSLTDETEFSLADSQEDGKGNSPTSVRTALRRWSSLLQLRTFWLLMLQGVPGCVPWGVIFTFLPDYLHVDAGLTVHGATVVMGFFQLGGLLGSIVGSEVGQRLYNLSPQLPPVLMVIAGSLGVLPMWILIRSTPTSVLGGSAVAFMGGTLASMTGPNVRATLSNVTESRQRGVAFASFILFDDVGKGAGPIAVAALVRAYGRRTAFALAMLCWIPCAALNGLTALTVVADQRSAAIRARTKAGDVH